MVHSSSAQAIVGFYSSVYKHYADYNKLLSRHPFFCNTVKDAVNSFAVSAILSSIYHANLQAGLYHGPIAAAVSIIYAAGRPLAQNLVESKTYPGKFHIIYHLQRVAFSLAITSIAIETLFSKNLPITHAFLISGVLLAKDLFDAAPTQAHIPMKERYYRSLDESVCIII